MRRAVEPELGFADTEEADSTRRRLHIYHTATGNMNKTIIPYYTEVTL